MAPDVVGVSEGPEPSADTSDFINLSENGFCKSLCIQELEKEKEKGQEGPKSKVHLSWIQDDAKEVNKLPAMSPIGTFRSEEELV